ncbi:PAS domain S-box protein [Streptomyces sp. 21So2-11]|uniref:PAS domain S-box protein n=1 Tax=Streptomyces sp. 21So2-11 TaxID=3144408 RepID=UPI003218FE5D
MAVARGGAQGAAALSAALACTGLLGWLLDSSVLKSVLPGQSASMKPNAALALLLLAIALHLGAAKHMTPWSRRAARGAAAAAAGIGALTLLQYATGADLFIDEALFRDDTAAVATAAPGRMAPNTALGLLLAGLAQLAAGGRRPRTVGIGQGLALAVLLIGLLRLYGFVYRVPELAQIGQYTGMALHTALALALLGAGTFLARPGAALAGLLTNAGTTGTLGRWILGATFVVPPGLGWAHLAGQDAGLYDNRLGVAMLVTGNVCAFSVVGFWALAVGGRVETARAHAEQKAGQYAQLQAFMDHSPAVIFMKDLNGRYLAVNTRFEQVFQADRDRVLGARDEDLLPRPAAEETHAAEQAAQAAGCALQREHLIAHQDGPHHYLTALFPLTDSSGVPYAVGGIATDVTARITAQRENDRLHRRFRGLLEAAPDAMVITDGDSTIVLVNRQAEQMFGYPRGELVGQPVTLLVPERLRAGHAAHQRAYLQFPQVRPMGAGLDLKGRRKDGGEFPVEISLSPVGTEDGLLISAAIRDVTDRQQAEQRLRELAAMVETCQDAIFTQTPQGLITYWNTAAERLYGYTATEAIGRHVALLTPPEREQEVTALLERLRQAERIEHFETVRLTKDGRLIDVELTLSPIRGPDGTVLASTTSARDITDRKQAEAERRTLYEQQRHIALTLQRSLMGVPPPLPQLATAHRYLASAQGSGVGGDWFDLIPLDANRTGIVVGDVMGRGLEAAAVMGQLRAAAHALAKTGMTPEHLMHALDAFVGDLPDQLVTCCYLILDPDQGEVTACSAGHLPVLLGAPGTPLRPLPTLVSVPLGVGGFPHRQTTHLLTAGTTLALYTDGLVEQPDTDIDTRIEALTDALQSALTTTPSLESAADHVLDTLLPDADTHDDDVTLLLVHLPATTPLASASTELDAHPRAVATGRRFLTTTLHQWHCSEETVEAARLLTSELLTNAVRHARGPIGLHLYHAEAELTVEVTDRSPRLPHPRHAGPDAEDGRGLALVAALADTWGTHPHPGGKTLWFTLALKPSSGDCATSRGFA